MTLTCPEPENFAAIAKQLHETALQAENEIYAAEQAMRHAVNLPVVVITSTAALTSLSNGVVYALDLTTFTTNFDNTAGGSGFAPYNFGFFTEFLGAGLYEVGLCLTAVASGAVTDNSVRQFLIQQYRPDPTSITGETEIQAVGFLMFESNTGVGSEASFVGHFRAEPGDRFGFLFYHENVASTMNVNTGMIMWAAKVSDSTLTRVL